MEAYYKARKKKLSLFAIQIKKLRKSDRPEDQVQAKELKKAHVALLLEPCPARDKVMSEEAYLKEMKTSFRQANESVLSLKLDACYDLYRDLKQSLNELDVLETKTNSLRKIQETIQKQRKEREKSQAEKKKQDQEKYNGLTSSYLVLDKEDQYKMYRDLETLGAAMSNPHRKVVAYEIEHHELEYRLTQVYEPFVPIKLK